jgi:hypothetical protein
MLGSALLLSGRVQRTMLAIQLSRRAPDLSVAVVEIRISAGHAGARAASHRRRRVKQPSPRLLPLAGFEVTLIGRFWGDH